MTIDEEQSVLTPQGVITTGLFKETCSRYWRISIMEIPFTSFSLRDFISTAPDYTCGTHELDVPTIPITQQLSIAGPCIELIDVYGTAMFPSVPPPPLEVWNCNLTIQTLRLWFDVYQVIHVGNHIWFFLLRTSMF